MKRIYALFVGLLLLSPRVLAQQSSTANSLTSTPTGTSVVAKKSVSRKKSGAEAKELKAKAAAEEKETLPPLLTERLKKFSQAVQPDGGLSNPGGLAHQEFMHRAYPDTKIPMERIVGERAAHASIVGHNFFSDIATSQWESYGPSLALYPFTPLRNSTSYVPNAYPAASRTTSLALSPVCMPKNCTLWAGPAGGGVWRTSDPFDNSPQWTYLSSVFAINAIGSLELDPNDPTGQTIYAGTGEANACGSGCEAGVGLYKSTDGGDTWTGPLGRSVFNARAIGTIAVKPGDPNTIYVGTTQGLRGQSSVCCNGTVDLIPGAPKWGLYKTTDGGHNWTFIHNGSTNASECIAGLKEAENLDPCSPFGVRRVLLDPSNPDVVYAGSYARGVWRSTDAGTTWVQIKKSLDATNGAMRPEMTVTTLPNGKTRMYVAEGAEGASAAAPNDFAQLFRSDDTTKAGPTFIALTSPNPAKLGYGSYNYCEGQCWYDNFVKTPPGNPDMVYLGGSYAYGETGNISNGRGVVLSTDAGVSFTDMTMDATSVLHPNGTHPDQHFIVINPNNPLQYWESSDGGIMRSSGDVTDISANCASRGISGVVLTRCEQLLSRVPSTLSSMNKGLTTLQFQSLSVNPFDSNDVQGGTQDNGTWETTANPSQWNQTIFGDGGQSGFDFANRQFRMHTYAGPEPDVNFSGGALSDWNFIGDSFFLSGEPSEFYFPIIMDPTVHKTMFAGMAHVFRTKTQGVGNRNLAAFRANCNEFRGVDPEGTCGDWVPLGDPSPNGALTGSDYGKDRAGIDVAAVARTPQNSHTLWAATAAGRVFISKNADADPETSVVFTRLDSLASNSPERFISSIFVDPGNSNHAWISYSGFNASTPKTPGHVFDVTYNPVAGTATWTDVSFDLADLPITGLAHDGLTGDLFASSDFGVYRLVASGTSWSLAAPGMPNIEVAGLTLVQGARKLYAASHGQGAWLLKLSPPQ